MNYRVSNFPAGRNGYVLVGRINRLNTSGNGVSRESGHRAFSAGLAGLRRVNKTSGHSSNGSHDPRAGMSQATVAPAFN